MSAKAADADIQRADPHLRRRSAVVLTLAALGACVLAFAFHAWLARVADAMPADLLVASLRRWIRLALIACGVCVLLLAGYAARLARRILEERRWPLASARVLHDTRIRRGAAAARIALALNAAALLLIALVAAGAALAWHAFGARA
ncbi:MAG TPA: hypothetical protein VGC30_14935 [Dokdonella sp.]